MKGLESTRIPVVAITLALALLVLGLLLPALVLAIFGVDKGLIPAFALGMATILVGAVAVKFADLSHGP